MGLTKRLYESVMVEIGPNTGLFISKLREKNPAHNYYPIKNVPTELHYDSIDRLSKAIDDYYHSADYYDQFRDDNLKGIDRIY